MRTEKNQPGKRPMPHPALWALRYKSFIFHRYKDHYLESADRDSFLKAVKEPLFQFMLSVLDDPYQREINSLWRQSFYLKEKLSETLRKIESLRHKYYQQQAFGREYNQPYVPVADFVEITDQKAIIKFLIRCGVGNYFSNTINLLEQARKRGGLHEREELAILRRVMENAPQVPNLARSQTGFNWVGHERDQRIKNLYTKLRNRGYIHKQTSLEQFTALFNDVPVEQPVIWQKTSVQLMYLVDRLLDSGLVKMPENFEDMRERRKELLTRKNRGEQSEKQNKWLKKTQHEISAWQYERMTACFLDKKGKPLSGQKLKHTRNELDNKGGFPKTAAEIDGFFSALDS